MKIRSADFAGSWYPDKASECEREIKHFLKERQNGAIPERTTGGIVPHAGWFFSGSIACNVIKALSDDPPPEIFVIFGMHLHPGSPSFIMCEGAWETPFGRLPIHEEIADKLAEKFPFQIETPERYHRDNTIELQLPFIKFFHKEARIVPVGVPPSKIAVEIGSYAAKLAARFNVRMKILGSTDLTHYGSSYGFTPKGGGVNALEWVKNENDRKVINAMLCMEPEKVIQEGLTNHNACCSGAAAAAIAAGKQLGSKSARTIAYSTSYEKSPGDSFVGYIGIVF